MKKLLIVTFLLVLAAASFIAGNWYQKQHATGNITHEGRNILYYVDPMNPGIKYDKPGVAPCGMPLEPVYPGGSPAPSGMPAGTVNVSAEQQQLTGVKVATVEKAPYSHTMRVLGRV